MADLTDLLRIVRTAEAACEAVVRHPEDALARESLMLALTSLSAALIAEAGAPRHQLEELLLEAQVWADIVCTRIIALSPTRKSIHAFQAVRYPARDLLEMLRRLAHCLEHKQER